MKKYFFICFALFTISHTGYSQDEGFKKFKFDFRLGYDIPTESNTNSGFAYGFEPKFYFNKNISFGLKIDYSRFGSDIADVGIGEFSSFVLTTDYFSKSDKDVKLFGGIGGGIYNSGYTVIESENNLDYGFLSRIGIEFKEIRISFEYNHVFSDQSFSTPNYYGFHISSSIF